MPQLEMPLAGDIEQDFDASRVAPILSALSHCASRDAALIVAKDALQRTPRLFHDLRKLLGIMDKQAYLELSYRASRTRHPSLDQALCGCQAWTMGKHDMKFFLNMLAGGSGQPVREAATTLVADYLLDSGLLMAGVSFASLTTAQLQAMFDLLIKPRETQQKAAKRRGHGCEGAVAQVLAEINVPFLPKDKATNPMGAKDPNVDRATLDQTTKARGKTYSFDLLVLDRAGALRIAIQSLIHTSDPGQYGVNKSDETVAIARDFAEINKHRALPVELWGLLDGVGFSENKPDTINKMLPCFDCFIQLKTLYKIPLRLHQLGLANVAAIRFSDRYTIEDVEAISGLYVPTGVTVLNQDQSEPPNSRAIIAGLATIYLKGDPG